MNNCGYACGVYFKNHRIKPFIIVIASLYGGHTRLRYCPSRGISVVQSDTINYSL